MERLPDGCSLFSHARCNDVLFLGNDRVQDLGEDSLANMETINTRFGGLIPVWVIVPDKSTIYLNPDKRFWDEAERRFHAPNLLRTFRLAIQDKIVDLYPANNTHLSTTGYLLMGDSIYQSMPHDKQKSTAKAEAGFPGQ
jgi:ribosomal protein L39E